MFTLTCNKLPRNQKVGLFFFKPNFKKETNSSIHDSITTNWVQFGNLNVKLRRPFEVSNSFTFEAPELFGTDLRYSERKSFINLSNLDWKWNLDRSE